MRGNITLLLALFLLSTALVAAEPKLSNLDVRTTQSNIGDILHVSYTLTDDRPLGRIITHTYLPRAIDHKTVETTARTYHYQDSFLLPPGYGGEQYGFVRIKTTHNPTIQRNFVVNPSGHAQAPQMPTTTPPRQAELPQDVRQALQGQPLAIVISPEVPNVAQGDWVYWPITLINNQDRPVTVQLGVQGIRDWGTYRIDPEPTITVPARGEYQSFMYISIDHDAWTGLRSFWITAEYDGIYQEREVALAVLRPAEQKTTIPWWVWGGLIGLLILALLITIIVLIARRNDQEEEDDFVTYY